MTHCVMLDVGAVMINTHGNYGRSDCIKGEILSTYIHTFIDTYMYMHVQKNHVMHRCIAEVGLH